MKNGNTMYQNQSKQLMMVRLPYDVLWNQQVQTDRTITNNKRDMIMCDNKIRNRRVAISAD